MDQRQRSEGLCRDQAVDSVSALTVIVVVSTLDLCSCRDCNDLFWSDDSFSRSGRFQVVRLRGLKE